MNNDLSKLKVGDWVWHIRLGWVKITGIDPSSCYLINAAGAGSYDLDGKFLSDDVAPTLFAEPPACFNAAPKPCQFVKGQRVLVRDSIGEEWQRAYFSHRTDNYCVFFDGDEWMSNGETTWFNQCKSWEEGEE